MSRAKMSATSDDWTIFVPVDPKFVPFPEQREGTWHLVASVVPDAPARWEVSEEPVFVDAGGNWEGVQCPSCGASLDDEWWSAAVSRSFADAFRSLSVELPCCGRTESLNDLTYPWQVAFGRARLVLDGSPEVPPGVINEMEHVLRCGVRTIRRHI